MKRYRYFSQVMIIILLTLSSLNLVAQQTTIPFCENIRVIDPQLNRRSVMFTSYNDFQQATLSRDNQGLIVTITYKQDGIFQTETKRISEAELQMLCEELSGSISGEGHLDDDFSQEARRRLIASSTTFSLGFYGWGIPLALGADDGKAYAASYLLVGGAGFFIPLISTRNKDISSGMAWGYTYGAGLGILHGFSLGRLIDSDDFQTNLGLTVGFSLAESFAGYSLAKNRNYSWGKVSSMGSGGIWGFFYGAALPILFVDAEDVSPSLMGITTLATSGIGIWAGSHLYSVNRVTPGDVVVLNSLGLLGTSYSFATLQSIKSENQTIEVAAFLIGASAGLAGGILQTKNYNYTRQQGNLIAIGGLAGGLVGSGIGVLTDASLTGHLWASSLGATGGIFLTDYLVKDIASSSGGSASNVRLQFNPGGLYGAFHPNHSPYKPWDPRYSNSLVNLNLTF